MARPGTFDTKGDRLTTKRPHKPYHRKPDSQARRLVLQVRVGPSDLSRIDALATALGLTRSATVRRAVERLEEDLLP